METCTNVVKLTLNLQKAYRYDQTNIQLRGLECEKLNLDKLRKIVHDWNGHLEIVSRPRVIENSRQFLLLRTDILQKTVVGCPWAHRRQRRQQSDHKHVQRLQLHCKWSRWREGPPTADASKSDEEVRQRIQFKVTLLWCNDRQQQLHDHIFPRDWGQPISLYTMSSFGCYSKFYFTMNSL